MADDDWVPSLADTPYARLGGAEAVRALVETFYDEMQQHWPELAAVHARDESGRITQAARDRFALFLAGWLGGPQEYTERHGHPRLRMRHSHVAVHIAARDAWLDSMRRAMDARRVDGQLRRFLNQRFAEVANFLRNQEE